MKIKSLQNKKKPTEFRLFLGMILCFLTSCGYHWVNLSSKTISIPSIAGDLNGAFTAELTRAIANQCQLQITDQGNSRLVVSIIQEQDEPISYRLDPQKIRGKIRKNLLADRARKTLTVELSLYEGEKEEPIFGPHRVTAYADYDYVDGDSFQDLTFPINGQAVPVLAFSLGQLEPPEAARQAALRPLYRKLSQKIVDLISVQCYTKQNEGPNIRHNH